MPKAPLPSPASPCRQRILPVPVSLPCGASSTPHCHALPVWAAPGGRRASRCSKRIALLRTLLPWRSKLGAGTAELVDLAGQVSPPREVGFSQALLTGAQARGFSAAVRLDAPREVYPNYDYVWTAFAYEPAPTWSQNSPGLFRGMVRPGSAAGPGQAVASRRGCLAVCMPPRWLRLGWPSQTSALLASPCCSC